MSYSKSNIFLTDGQKKNLTKAINNNSSIKIKLSNIQIKQNGNVPILLTNSQINKINKSKTENKGMVLNMSMAQIRANKKEGGILPFLIPIAIAGASAIAGGIASWGTKKALDAVDKAIEKGKKGNGLMPLGQGLRPLGQGLRPLGQGLTPLGVPIKKTIRTPVQASLQVGGCMKCRGSGLFPKGVKQ
jgi:hypothetical protein